ncbi:MAG: fluoride efflux transporter CrcB [Methylohalobius sp.]|nr:fluoride efflux transporter CrcB [Methylohalobius sp.]
MSQVIAIALGGAVGALLRFLVNGGIHGWLGHGFPYGTLAVNVVGSYLIGLMSEALILERVALAMEFRAGLLVGGLGAFTTFSTFSVETLILLGEGRWLLALGNVAGNVVGCLLAVVLGLLSGRSLFYYARGIVKWRGVAIPYAIFLFNFFVSFLFGFFLVLVEKWLPMVASLKAVVMVLTLGGLVTLSSLYLALFLLEVGIELKSHGEFAVAVLLVNTVVCSLGIGLGWWGGIRW